MQRGVPLRRGERGGIDEAALQRRPVEDLLDWGAGRQHLLQGQEADRGGDMRGDPLEDAEHDLLAALDLADLDAGEFNADLSGVWTRGLLIRRNISDGELAFFTTWCPEGTGMETLVRVEGHRWAIEDSFETAKNELGLDHNETRSWHGWHRHVSLVMLAFAMMATIRHHANVEPPKKTMRRLPRNPS